MLRPHYRLMNAILLVGICFYCMGCSKYFTKASESSNYRRGYSLPAPQLKQNSVAIELAVVTLDGERLQMFQEAWEKCDQQGISLSQRKRLDANGFRVGVLGQNLPGEMRKALAWSRPLLTADGEPLTSSRSPLAESDSENAFRIKRIEQLELGEQQWIPCSDAIEQLAWKIQLGGSESGESRSGTCQMAQCGFRISQKPDGDNSVLIRLHPVIRHGQSKMRYNVDYDSLLIQQQQDQLTLPELNIDHPLRLGQTLMISSTAAQTEGFGQQFFAGGGGFSAARQVLLIRPVLINGDDLFAPQHASRALSTSLE